MAFEQAGDDGSTPLPSGGGAQGPVGENFDVDLATGSGSYRLPFSLPPGPRQLEPELELTYGTGYGNGPIGVGWILTGSAITRSSLDGRPDFDDRTDDFSYGGQRLVEVAGGRYRQQVEKDFFRIERSGPGWIVQTPDGNRLRYGATANSRIDVDGALPDPTLSWLLAQHVDEAGNVIDYGYRHDRGHAYLETVSYGPYRIDLTYEERPDVVVSHVSGSRREMRLRLTTVRLTYTGDPAGDEAIKEYRLTYEQAAHTGLSGLRGATLFALGAGGVEEPAPGLEFGYSDIEPGGASLEPIRSEMPLPTGDEAPVMFADLDGDGLVGMLQLSANGGYYWANRGGLEMDGVRRFGHFPRALAERPDRVKLASLSGHGLVDLVVLAGRSGGYYALLEDGTWDDFRAFVRPPAVPLLDARTRLLDLDFDGRADLLYADDRAFYAVLNNGRGDFGLPRVVNRVHDRSVFPDLDLASPSVHVADMSGDGGADLVEIRESTVTYWPNLGLGAFGPAVVMENPPRLPVGFDPSLLFLTDVDGDGLADVLYVDSGRVLCWFNRSGHGFSEPVVIGRAPITTGGQVMFADLRGSGRAGLVYAGTRALGTPQRHFFLDVAGPTKANLLTSIRTPTGARITIDYDTAVSEAVQDRGTEDEGYVPFPVQIVRRIHVEDLGTGATATTDYAYHRGFYDRRLRRFNGFGRVEQIDRGDGATPDRITVSEFHTTPPPKVTGEALERHRAVSRMPFRVTTYGADDPSQPFWIQHVDAEAVPVDTGLDGTTVLFAARRRLRRTTTERGQRICERDVTFTHDDFGNVVVEREDLRWQDPDGSPRQSTKVVETRYLDDGPAYLVGVPAETIERDGAGELLAANRLHYDGLDFVGLPLGQATRGIMTRREALAFLDDDLPTLFGAEVPDLADLGYRLVDDPVLGLGWWFDEVSQSPDAFGNPSVRRDPLGNDTTFTFDAHGIHPVALVNAAGQTITQEYDHRHGQQTHLVDRDGQERRWTYDLHGRLLAHEGPQDPAGEPSLVYEHFPFETPSRLTIRQRSEFGVERFETRHHFHDARGELAQVRIELDGRVAVNRSATGWTRYHAIATTDAYFAASPAYSTTDAPAGTAVFTTTCDALDRPIEIVGPIGVSGRRIHEAGVVHNWDAEDVDPASPHADTPRSEYADPVGNIVAVAERLTASDPPMITRYERNGARMLTRIVAHDGQETMRQVYDRAGRLVARLPVDAGTQVSVLDAAGNNRQERRGDRRLFRTFDELHRLESLRYGDPASAPVETYSYDSGTGDNLAGRLARAEGTFGSVDYSYSSCGRLRAKTRTFPSRPGDEFVTRFRYDPLGRVRAVVYPDGETVEVGYDEGGRAVSVSDVVDAVEFDAAGYMTRMAFANGVTTSYDYGSMPGLLSEIRTAGPGGDTYHHARYSFDRVGNPLHIDDLANAVGHVRDDRVYGYDALYRLTSAQGRDTGGTYSHVYDYDDRGNLLSRPEVAGNPTLSYTGHRLTGSTAGGPFDYDDLGNLTTVDGWTHDYDDRGRLTESTAANGDRVITVYDHAGVRVSTETVDAAGNSSVTLFCDDTFVIAADGSTESYVFYNKKRIAVRRSAGGSHLIHLDPLGNPSCFSDLATGVFTGQLVFYPYGGVALSMQFGGDSRYLFGNHPELPGTGLSDFGMRAYSPRLGRFLQPDPAVLYFPEKSLALPRAQHPYGYVIGNPASLVDPHGAFLGGVFDAVGDFFTGVGEAIVGGVKAVGEAFAAVGSAIWEGVKAIGSAIWEGVKWVANAVWEGIKFLGRALAFVITWALTIVDFVITWLNPLNWIAIGLDQIDHPLASALSFGIKFLRSPITTTVGIGIGLYGLATGDVESVSFKKGLIVFEWDPGASGFSGTVLGGTAHLWKGTTEHEAFEHEVYHSYQYVGWGDAFIPAYVVGGLSGLLTSAMAGNPQWTCFGGVSDGYSYGQPLEMGGELIDASDNCH